MTFSLAIDQGTHASRACLFDEAGELICEHTKKIKIRRISDSHIEQDANEILDSVKEVIEKLLREVNTQQKIVSCGIAIQRSSVLAWKNDGTVISPVLSWQDTRGKQQVLDLEKHKTEIQQLSGLPLSAHYGASKLRYLLDKTKPHMMTLETVRLSPLISYLLFHILEEHPYIVDHSNAQRTQLFELKNLNWSTRLTGLFNIPITTLPYCVPVLMSPDMPHGILAGTSIPVCAISGDQNAAIYGAGLLKPETALVNFGTGAFILRLLSHYVISEKQLTGIACSDHNAVQYVREATINGAASALAWLEKQHQANNILQQLPVWLNEIKQPPLFINSIGGLGSPWWHNNIEAEFVVSHSTSSTVTADLATTDLPTQAVAVIESIVFMVCVNLEIMQSEQSLSSLRLSGGLSQLDGLCQRLANLSGLRIERMKLTEATARGVAWLAAGKPDSWSSNELDVFEPVSRPALVKRYAMFNTVLQHYINKARHK